jgi:hypothetical protein
MASASTLPRQPVNIDAQTYNAKDENRQRNCKKDGVPVHVVLRFEATELTGAEVRDQPIGSQIAKVRRKVRGPGSGLMIGGPSEKLR